MEIICEQAIRWLSRPYLHWINFLLKEGRKEGGREGQREEGRKEGRKEGVERYLKHEY
jgi:hypothetical protein